MSAEDLRQAAQTLRERARAATPGPWERGDHWHIQGAKFCPCQPSWGKAEVRRMDINGQMMQAHIHRLPDRLGWDHGIYSKAQDASGYYPNVVTDTDEYGLMGDADAEWIATMHPVVGLALAAVLDAVAGDVAILTDVVPDVSEETLDMNLTAYVESLALARLINGGGS